MKKILRIVLLALLASFVGGLVIGTVIRLRLERPVVYFVGQNGRTVQDDSSVVPSAAATRAPGDIGNVRPMVLDAGHHEEQVG
jgi:hypothetical protein